MTSTRVRRHVNASRAKVYRALLSSAAATLALSACTGTEHAPLPSWCVSSAHSARLLLAPAGSVPLSLHEVWRRGGLRPGEALGDPTPPVVGADGLIAIADFQFGTVTVLDTAGRWIGPVTTRGQGPGEVDLPATSAWDLDGTLAVLDAADLTIVRLRPPGFRFVAQVDAPQLLLEKSFAAGELLAVFLDDRDRVGVELPLERLDDQGDVRAVFALEAPGGLVDTLVSVRSRTLPAPGVGTVIAPGYPTPLAAAGPGGAVAVAGDIPQYRVQVLGSHLTDSLVVCRDVPPEPMTRSERGDTAVTGAGPLLDALKNADRPATLPAMGRVFFGTGGELWVQRARTDPLMPSRPPEGSPYDVYAPGGRYLGTVVAPNGVVLYAQTGTLVVGYERGSLDEISVVAYRLAGVPPGPARRDR